MRLSDLSTRGAEPVEHREPDAALVMSGGSVNGIFLQLGFLQALRTSAMTVLENGVAVDYSTCTKP